MTAANETTNPSVPADPEAAKAFTAAARSRAAEAKAKAKAKADEAVNAGPVSTIDANTGEQGEQLSQDDIDNLTEPGSVAKDANSPERKDNGIPVARPATLPAPPTANPPEILGLALNGYVKTVLAGDAGPNDQVIQVNPRVVIVDGASLHEYIETVERGEVPEAKYRFPSD